MPRTPRRAKSKPAARTSSTERRRALRGNLKLLTAFRCLDKGKESLTGFVRALNLSPVGALLESPDEFDPGQNLALEFLLDNNRIAQTDGRVTRAHKRGKFYHIAVEFAQVSPKTRRLIQLQVS
jgi:hypothetical protein